MTTSTVSRLGEAPEEGVKAPVKAISSGNLALFDIGMTIAGYVVQDNDRIAVNGQTDSTENGIYVARDGRSWVRASDFNANEDVANGQLLVDANTTAVYAISAPDPWNPGVDSVAFGLLLSPSGFFWGAIGGTLSDQGDLQAELDAKTDVGHTHVEADITDLQPYLLDAPVDTNEYARSNGGWVDLTLATRFAPLAHTHVEADITDLQAYLLDAAGSIAADGELYARKDGMWEAFSTAAGTVGEIIIWPDVDPPENFLLCDGQSYNTTVFSDLFAVVGYKYGGSGSNFNVPDLRGEFIRGTANGSGNDPDRASRTDRGDGTTGDAVGTKQPDAQIPHSHGIRGGGSDDDGGPRPPGGTSNNGALEGTQSGGGHGTGNEVRPRNVGMNFMIRFTGGGSGITQPPTIEIQDNTVSLTTAVQLINFVGFTVTEPVDDEITITFGASPNSALYCPGYAYNFISTISWSIVGFDVTQTFSVGRRLQFTDGAVNYYGTILTSSFSGGNTVMTMSMEGGDVLTSTITEVCLTTSADAWGPIAEDPFSGGPINGITSGSIGGTTYWVICGNNGLLAVSSDAGLTWTLQSSGTTEDLNDVAYNPDEESFLAVGDAGEYTHSTDASTWTADSSKFAALPEAGGGTYDIYSVCYDIGGGGWRTIWNYAGSQVATAYSSDDTGTWASSSNIGSIASVTPAKIKNRVEFAGGNLGSVYPTGQDVQQFDVIPDEAGAIVVNHSGQGNTTALLWVADSVASVTRQWNGHENGEIFYGVNDADADTTPLTFGSSAIREFAYADSLSRLVAVADDGKIGYLDSAVSIANPAFTLVANGSNPLANFTGVHWNQNDAMFIAVNNQGQILRSSNGLDNIPLPEFTGFTLIAADPFSGQPINRIISGSIGGDHYWVAIGQGGALYTSTDAGVTWTVRTTGTTENLLCIGYNPDNEQFFVGCSNGAFLHSSSGTSWTLDTTTLPALGGTGSDDVDAVLWDQAAGLWWIVFDFTGTASRRTYTTDNLVTTFTPRDTSITWNTNSRVAGGDINNVLAFCQNDDTQYFNGAADTTDSTYYGITATLTQFIQFGPSATAGFVLDAIIGYASGELRCLQSTTGAGILATIGVNGMAGVPRAAAYSTVSNRWCVVGDSNEVRVLDRSSFTAGQFLTVNNPFTGNINDIWYSDVDDLFIAVGANGEIGRSTDGIS